MLREMSPLRIFRRSSQKNVIQEESENAFENPSDFSSPSLAMVGSTRMPLCPISELAQNPQSITADNSSVSRVKFDGTPTKSKGKVLAKADSSEAAAFTTPEKPGLPCAPSSVGNTHIRNRFGWPQKHDSSSRDNNVASGRRSPLLRDNHNESTGELICTPRLASYANGNETHLAGGNVPHSNKCFGVGNGGSIYGTPRSIRTGGKASSNHSESGSNSSTPTKSVSRVLNNGQSGGPSGAAMNTFRCGSQNSAGRTGNYFQTSKYLAAAAVQPVVVNTVEVPHFDLSENPAFWMDHNVQVLIRIRPVNAAEVASQGYSRCLKQESSQTVTWLGPPETRFTFDHVACETITQEMLFKVAGLPMVDNCMSGYNSCMFAYGQTGSGKTHTMLGDIDELDQRPSVNRGMTPRIFEYLFARIRAEEESRRHERLKYVCKCSFLEIYNEQITDLLEPSSTNLQLREDIKKGVYVDNLSEVEVNNVYDIVQLLLQGAANRRVAATNMNHESSRSHSVFTCVIESRWEKDSMTNIRYGRLNLVDLAGSERQKSSGAEGERLKEAANINKSLSTLGLVIMILVDVAHGKQRHIPYRDSRLTFLLQDSLGGNSKTTIIANISPSLCSMNETLSTLKFAQRAKFIQNNAIVNEDASGDVTALQLQIKQLKEELNLLKCQNVSRSLSFRSAIFSETIPGVNGEGSLSALPINNAEAGQCSLDSLQNTRALGSPRMFSKKVRSLEATLAGALRREQVAENAVKQLEAEIELLNRLVRQREEDTHNSKMILRFREEKIQRLEHVLDGVLSADAYLLEEKNALYKELQLIRGRFDRNPELTRFATENLRLMEEVRRFQGFFEGGERDILLEEVAGLRDQLIEALGGKFEQDKNPCTLSSPQELLSPELAGAARENQLLRLEVDSSRKEIEDCRNNLNASLEANAKMTREIDKLHVQLDDLKATCFQQQKELETWRKEFQSVSGETVETDNIQQQIITDLKAQLQVEMEQRTQLEDSQASTKQEKVQREQELEMRHSEEIMQLQLELESFETVLEEERVYRKEAEDRASQLSQELKAALAKIDDGRSVIEALESQQLFSINEMENLQEKNKELLELLRKKEEEGCILKRQHGILQEELNRGLKLKAMEREQQDQHREHINCVDSSMQAKLERMQKALDQARRLNMRFQYDQASQTSHEEEMDQVRKQVETETAEAIICLQEELVILGQQVDSMSARESESNEHLMLLKNKVEELQATLSHATEENETLVNTMMEKDADMKTLQQQLDSMSAKESASSEHLMHLKMEVEKLQVRLSCATEENGTLVNTMRERDEQIKTLKDEWDRAARELANFLEDGDQALDDASEQIENIKDSFPQRRFRIDQGVERIVTTLAEKEKIIEVLQKQLQHAHNLAHDTEEKIKSLKEATLAITEVQQQENDEMAKDALEMRLELSEKLSIIQVFENKVELYEGSLKEAEKRASAAFMTAKKLSEISEAHLKAEKRAGIQLEEAWKANGMKDNLIQDLKNEIFQSRLQIDCLEQQVMKFEDDIGELKSTLAFEQDKVKAAEMKAELNEQALHKVEDHVEKSWQRVFEVEASLCLSFGAFEREISAERLDSIMFFDSFSRQVQEHAERVNVLQGGLLYEVGNQAKEIEKANQSLKEFRVKENTLVIAFVEAILAAKKMQQCNDRIMCEFRKTVTSLKSVQGNLTKADLELKEKDLRLQEMSVALQALEVVKASFESEKQQLLLVADQASSTCSEKEQALDIAQQELASIQVRLEEIEGKNCSLNATMNESLKQLKDVEEEHSRLLVDWHAEKCKWDDERQRLYSEKEELKEQMAIQRSVLTEELVVTQSKLQTTEKKLAELISTVQVLTLERSNWEIEREALNKDAADAHSKISDNEKQLSSFHGILAEVQLKLKLEEDKADALSNIVNDLTSSEEHWRSEREVLASRVELLQVLLVEREKKIEVLQNQRVTQITENISKSTVTVENDKPTVESNLGEVFKDSCVVEQMKIESQKLRENLIEKDQTILSVRKEMEAALASLKEAEIEMDRTLDEKEDLRKAEEQGRQRIDSLTADLKHLQGEMNHKEKELELLQLEMARMLQTAEERMEEAEERWRKGKEMLSLELTDARLIAAEKSSEAATILRKFEESQETIKEADLMLNALLRVNETAKCDTERWKNAGQELVIERGSLIDEIQRTKTAISLKEDQFRSIREQILIGTQETRDLILAVEEFAMSTIRGLEEEFKEIDTEIGKLRQDLSQALDTPKSWFEEIWLTIAEKDCAVFVLHACQIETLLGNPQAFYTQIGSLHQELNDSNTTIHQLEKDNTILREIERHSSLWVRLEMDVKNSLDSIIVKEKQIESLTGRLETLEEKLSDLQGQEESMMKRLTFMDWNLTGLMSEVEQRHVIELEAASELEQMQREKEELYLQLDKSRKIMINMEKQQELLIQSIHTEMVLLRGQLDESNLRSRELEKGNDDLKEEIKWHKITTEGQEESMMKMLTAKEFELAVLMSEMEQKHKIDLEILGELEHRQREKELCNKITTMEQQQELVMQSMYTQIDSLRGQLYESNLKVSELEKESMDLKEEIKQYEVTLAESCNKITTMEEQQEFVRQSMYTQIDSLRGQLYESNLRVSEVEKGSMDLKEDIKQYEVTLAELHLDLKDGSERTFESVNKKDCLAARLETLKMEVSNLKMEKERLGKGMMDKMSEVAILRQELDGHTKVQSFLAETLARLDDLQREKQEISIQLEQSHERIEQLEEERLSFRHEISKLQEGRDKLHLEFDQCHKDLTWFRKLSADANEELKKREEETVAVHRQLEQASSYASSLEQEDKMLRDKLSMLEISLGTLQSDVDEKHGCLSEFQLAHSKTLKELRHKNQEIEGLMSKLNILEAENMGLRDEIVKEVETRERLCSELQQSNNVTAEIRREHDKSMADLQEREADISMLVQQKEIISNKLSRMEVENKELKEIIVRRDETLRDFTDQIALKDDYLKRVNTLAQLTNDNCCAFIQLVENFEVKLFDLQDKVLYCVPMERVDEMHSAFIDKFLKCTSVLEEKAHVFLAQTELLEMNSKDLLLENTSLKMELKRKEEVLKGLQFDLSLLQDSVSKAKDREDEVQEATAALKLVQEHLKAKTLELNAIQSQNNKLEIELVQKASELNSLNSELTKLKDTVAIVSNENSQLMTRAEDLLMKKNSAEDELEDKQKVIEGLEEELLEMGALMDQNMIHSMESMKCDLNNVIRERDRLHAEVLVLNEQLEMAQAFADEREAIAVEAHQIADARKTYAEEKEEEAKLLERSVEELEHTVNALENQVDIVKREAERQRLMREDLELELQALRHQMSTMKQANTASDIQSSSDLIESENENQRLLGNEKLELHEPQNLIKNLEKEIEEKDAEIKKCKAHIAELITNAETQANEYQQKYKALEAMAHQVKTEQTNSNVTSSSANKIGEKTAAKSRGSGSPFKCIGLGLAQQMNSEMDEELYASRRRIEELEALAAARQKEIFMLNARLAAAESMTHDVIRDLLGVKLDMTNYASVLDHQQVQKMAEKARRQSEESQEKEQELLKLKHQLNEFIEERESWLDEINRRQAEMVAARIAAEKLRQRDQFLTTENEMLKADNANQKRRLVELEDEVKKLSGQQNLQQRIHHHAKIKEENNMLRAQHEDLSARLRRTEVLLARVNEELARYRTADGRTPYISIDEEQRLRNKLQETEMERVQLAQKLLSLCTSILQAAGIVRAPRDIDPSFAVETLHQLKDRLECAERELRDLKIKTRIAGEKMRLCELRQQSNSPLSVKANENSFTDAQKCPSPGLSNVR